MNSPAPIATAPGIERILAANTPEVLTHVYRAQINLAIWQRQLAPELTAAIATLLQSPAKVQCRAMLASAKVPAYLEAALPEFERRQLLIDDIATVVEMFSCLFELDEIGLRLATLDTAMCPKFHVDRVPCRLVTTYGGPGTEWLPDAEVERSKLGAGCNGLSDEESGLMRRRDAIAQLAEGDVGLIKGELWQGNENRGLVHRSPALEPGQKRLLLTLDFA